MNRTHPNQPWTLALLALLAPAVAALLVAGGCDDNEADEVEVEGTTSTIERPVGDTMDETLRTQPLSDEATAEPGVALSDTVKQTLSDLNERFQEAADDAKGEPGADEAVLGRANEVSDSLQNAFNEGNLADAARHLGQLRGMKDQLPANLQGMIDQMVNAVPANVKSMMDTAGGAMNRLGGLGDQVGDQVGDQLGGEQFDRDE